MQSYSLDVYFDISDSRHAPKHQIVRLVFCLLLMDYLWFGVVTISNLPSLTTNQVQPDPNNVVALFANSFLNSSKVPHCALMSSITPPFLQNSGDVIPRIMNG